MILRSFKRILLPSAAHVYRKQLLGELGQKPGGIDFHRFRVYIVPQIWTRADSHVIRSLFRCSGLCYRLLSKWFPMSSHHKEKTGAYTSVDSGCLGALKSHTLSWGTLELHSGICFRWSNRLHPRTWQVSVVALWVTPESGPVIHGSKTTRSPVLTEHKLYNALPVSVTSFVQVPSWNCGNFCSGAVTRYR